MKPTAAFAAFVFCTGLTLAPAAQADESFECLAQPGPYETVSGFITDRFEPDVAAGKKFDARSARFEYPETRSYAIVRLGRDTVAPDMCWAGGFFTASTSWHELDISWSESKRGYDNTDTDRGKMEGTSSVSSFTNRMTWTGLHVYNMHDGMRTQRSDSNWTVQHVWLDYIRDDCIENDQSYGGTIYDSLFDGCYTGFSARDGGADGVGEVVTMDKVLLRMEPMPYPYKWDTRCYDCVYIDGHGDVPFEHGSIFKLQDIDSLRFAVTNSVFLLEVHSRYTLFPPKSKVTACENNTIIWLDGPETAPIYLLDEFPDCFTLITDPVEGRQMWGAAVADWHARHPEVGANRKPAQPGSYHWPRYEPVGAGVDYVHETNGALTRARPGPD